MEAIAIVAGIVGLIWGTIVLRRGGLLAGCLAVLLAGTCFSVPFFKLDLGPVPITAERVLLVVLVAQYLLWRRFGWADPKPMGKAEFILLALLGVLTFSTFSGDWHIRNSQPLSWLIISYLMPAVLYWVARETKYTQQAVLAMFACLALMGVYLALTALAEYFKLWSLVFPRYIVTSAAQAEVEFVGRGRGPLLNPIANGILLAIGLGSVLMWWPRLGRAGQLTLPVIVLLFSAAFYCSLTRSVWMGGLLTLGLAVGLSLPWKWRWSIFGAAVVAGVVGRQNGGIR
jgi:hypothetical protein